MSIPLQMQARARSKQWVGVGGTSADMDRHLLTLSERALQEGPRVGLEALVEAVVRLTGTSGAALYEGARCVAVRGLAPPPPGRVSLAHCIQDGRAMLVLGEPRPDEAERRALQRMVALGGSLLAALAREEGVQAERKHERQERLQLMRRMAHRERVWSRASHDLRTPLLVLQGYIEMMLRGVAGEMSAPARRYLDRMVHSAADLNARIHRFKADVTPPEDVRPLVRAALGSSGLVRLELPPEPVHVKATGSELALLVRTLERAVVGTRATQAQVRLEAPEGVQGWRLHLKATARRPLPARVLETLERLTRRWETPLTVAQEKELELTVMLPRLAK